MTKRLGMSASALVVAVAVLVLSGSAAQAFIILNWQTTAPVLVAGGSAYPGDAVPNGSLMQLIWTADMTMDAPMGSASPAGDDQILATATLNGGVGGFDAQTYYNTDLNSVSIAEFNAGHVYVRAWEAAAPVGGVHSYVQGGFVTTLNVDPGIANDYNNVDLCNSSLTPVDTLLPVPEPTSLALAGLGMLVVMIRRKLRA